MGKTKKLSSGEIAQIVNLMARPVQTLMPNRPNSAAKHECLSLEVPGILDKYIFTTHVRLGIVSPVERSYKMKQNGTNRVDLFPVVPVVPFL